MAVARGAKPVFEDETGDTKLVQETRVIDSFVRREASIATARTNDNRSACCGCRVRQVRS